jgi:hypothetical protein
VLLSSAEASDRDFSNWDEGFRVESNGLGQPGEGRADVTAVESVLLSLDVEVEVDRLE